MICILTKGYMCQLDTTLYPTEKIAWYLYALFINSVEKIKSTCSYKVKPEIHNAVYNVNKDVWIISALSAEKIQKGFLQRT